MYQSSGKSFGTTTGIQSGTDAFGESRSALTLANSGVKRISYSFWLVPQKEAGKQIPESSTLEFSEEISENIFALLDAEDHNPEQINGGGHYKQFVIWSRI